MASEIRAERIDDAVAAVRAVVESIPSRTRPLVLGIDGRSGAGKTRLALALADDPAIGMRTQLLHLDSLYPGWSGLDEGAEYVRDAVLLPLHAGRPAGWRRYDWHESAYAERHAVDPARPLIVEGCGLLRPDTRRLIDLAVWVDGPAELRKSRALARDGDAFRPFWDMWAAQEEKHILRDDPHALADLVIERAERA